MYQEAAVDALLANATVELALLSVDHEVRHAEERRARLSEMLGIPAEDFMRQSGMTDEEMQESTRETAVRSLTRSYALAALGEAEGLEVAQEDVEQRVEEMLAADGARPPRPAPGPRSAVGRRPGGADGGPSRSAGW